MTKIPSRNYTIYNADKLSVKEISCTKRALDMIQNIQDIKDMYVIGLDEDDCFVFCINTYACKKINWHEEIMGFDYACFTNYDTEISNYNSVLQKGIKVYEGNKG